MSDVFVIAEIGINHNGDLDLAKQLIKVASDAGADAVKFQKRDVDIVYTPDFLDSKRESPWGLTQRDQKVALEFSAEQYAEIGAYCRELNILWSASAWDSNSQKFLRNFDTAFNKVASAMIVDRDFLELVAEEKKKTFISTGMCDLVDIDAAVNIFESRGCDFELMHCVSTYPLKSEHANLRVINTLRERYGCSVGYSGHESGLSISYAAVALGASSLERHITLDRAMYGSDQAASVEPQGFRQLVGGVRTIAEALGDGVKGWAPCEREVAAKLRAHL